MKVSKAKIIQDNLPLIQKIVPNIVPGDSADVLSGRVGARITVTPDAPPNPVEETTIVFDLNCVMAVTKGCSMEDLLNLLSVAANGAFAAIGTGLTGTMQAANGIAGAGVGVLNEIMRTVEDEDHYALKINITDVPVTPGGNPIKLRARATVEGWTRTNDWDTDEIANFSYEAQIGTQGGNTIKTENVGKSSQVQINNAVSSITQPVSVSEVSTQCDLRWNLKTDGAFTHDTISLIKISTVTVTLDYVA